ncbi:hypothetical protein ACFO6V_15205 [Promicromonospora alba]|uniref:Uncharacterized protein n=1 Tax=Promicromonospora alba TaxID=1616110 RepID=A0ABV9HI62_9MICO
MTIEEYQKESEQIADRLMAAIEEVDRYQDDIIASENRFVNAESHDLEDHPWQYWQWHGTIVLAANADVTPEQAADRMAEVLESEGWTADEPTRHETTGKYEYRRPGGQSDDGWYVELGFWTDQPPVPQNLSVIVVSPSTDRTAADS